ncbi:unnamed protein product [Trichobilharzia szidati]|nr:unnamed protein product [Trichobilharzia szidati]
MYRLVAALLVFGFVSCDKVLELNDDNFDSELQSRPLTLVKFYAPWCGHCKQLAPAFKSAADIIAQKSDSVTLAKVDCTVHQKTCTKYKVDGYPTLKIFRNGKLDSEYEGPRSADGIVNYILSRAGPASKEISVATEVETIISDTMPTVVAFIKSASDPLAATFLDLAKTMLDDAVFSHSHNNIFGNSGDNEIRVYLPKRLRTKLESDFTTYKGDLSKQSIKAWIRKNGHGRVGYRSPKDSFYFRDSNLVVIYNNQSIESYPTGVKYWRNRLLKTLKDQTEKFKDLKFAYSFSDDFSHELSEFGLDSGEFPAARIRSSDSKKYKLDKFSLDSFLQFLHKFKEGSLSPYLKTEPLPSDETAAVKKLVALNFNEIVNDEKKDVMVVFHAPWCGHCQNLMPKYEEAAKKLKDESNVILAAMDATANDVPSPYVVSGFPTIYFVPKAKKSSPIQYQGGRTTEDIIKYVAREATDELSGYDRSGNEKKKEL